MSRRPGLLPLQMIALLVASLRAIAGAPSSAPGAVEAIAYGPHEVRVFWNAAPDAARYRIYRDNAPIGEAAPGDTRYTDTAVEPNTNYRYEVAAIDAAGAESRGQAYLERTFPPLPDETRCDVLVVGANAAGVSAAVTAARYGLNVVVIEATRRLGGMAVNGLGASDIRREEHASGFFDEFRAHVKALYGEGNGLHYEPRVSHQAMKEIVWAEPHLVVHRLVRTVRVEHAGRSVAAVIAEEIPTGRRVTFHPRLVVDATECGDVAASAGAHYRVGREPRSAREPHAGYIHYDRASDSRMPGSTGRGDRRIQAYAYLMIVKDYGPGADRTIPRPPGYDPAKYAGAPRWADSWAVSSGKLPNDKYEINQHPKGSDLQGVNYDYPTASYAERQRIEQQFRDHALGYLYYIQTVEGRKNIGLSDDDFRDNNGWPSLLYIREARRFDADIRMDETDILRARDFVRPEAIGIGDYAMDSHATQPAPDFDNYRKGPKDMGEGEFYLPQYTPWHQVPYRIMIPRDLDNVFVPTAVSATHVAYGTYRMEPVRMHFGAAAGVASVFCVRYGLTPRQVPVRQIQAELLKPRAAEAGHVALDGVGAPGPLHEPIKVYMFSDVTPATPKYRALQWLAARGFYPCPPPEKRTPSSLLAAAPCAPDGSHTVGEARALLAQLARRATPEDGFTVGALTSATGADGGVLTRAAAAQMLAAFLAVTPPAGADHYADLPAGHPAHAAAEALYATSIDSRLWDIEKALAPDGRLLFRPDTAVTRAQFAEMLRLAAIHLGPLWYDHPIDAAPTVPVAPAR